MILELINPILTSFERIITKFGQHHYKLFVFLQSGIERDRIIPMKEERERQRMGERESKAARHW